MAFPLVLQLSTYQTYGLFFLLGSIIVATISDLKRMAAQKEFFEFWLGFTVVMFLVEMYPYFSKQTLPNEVIGKWVVLIGLCLLSWNKIGVLFKLARMDVVAIAAVCSLFNVFWVVAFFPFLKVISAIESPILESEGRYPFLPVIFTALVTILILNIFYM